MADYPEKLLHWIWEQRHIGRRELRIQNGQKLEIRDTGRPNASDGPDFLNAKLQIGTLCWYGDVEIHWNISDWKSHGHHRDFNYNRVVLHVVFSETDETVLRPDKTPVPTLSLEPYVTEPLSGFLSRYRSSPALPCSGSLPFISREAFRQQLEKSHKEYFEKKVDDFIAFYNPGLKPSEAWLKAFAISLFDGLGITHNRLPMQRLARKLFTLLPETGSADLLRLKALEISGLADSPPRPEWNHKGCRPGNHPRFRIRQAAEMLWFIHTFPFEQWFGRKPRTLWQQITAPVRTKPGLGRERSSILYGTVLLPALYVLGNLFFAEYTKNEALSEWKHHQALIPENLLEPFKSTGIPSPEYEEKLGAVYQLRSYCHPRRCGRCKVFKSVISP